MRKPATDINTKQLHILIFILDSMLQHHRTPTVREICAHIGLSSPSSVQNHINTLEKFGYINREANKNRSISITAKGNAAYAASQSQVKNTFLQSNLESREVTSSDAFSFGMSSLQQVPLIGTVQAGLPITAEQNQEAVLTLPTELTGNSDCFLLRVQGDSMRDIGMYDGDLIIVRNQATANNGDVVVARIDDEATVKRFYKEEDHIRLQPENDEFEPIITRDCHIEGLVIGLLRDHI